MTEWGKGVTGEDLQTLRRSLERHARLLGDFVLSSGIKSKYYFDAKRVLLSPEGFDLIGRILFPIADNLKADAVGGLAVGAVPLALAVTTQSRQRARGIPTFIVRSDGRKGHGTKDEISASYPIDEADMDSENRHVPLIRPGRRLLIVDDVITTGDSVQQAIDALPLDVDIVAVVALVTRPEGGGTAKMQQRFPNYFSVYESDDRGLLRVNEQLEALLASMAV